MLRTSVKEYGIEEESSQNDKNDAREGRLGETSSHLRWTWLPKTNGITEPSNALHWSLWLIFLAGAMAFIQYFKKIPIRAFLRYLPGRLTGAICGIDKKIKLN